MKLLTELSEQWNAFIIEPINKETAKTDCNKHLGIALLSTARFYPALISQGQSYTQTTLSATTVKISS
jgi:hypothetical protein